MKEILPHERKAHSTLAIIACAQCCIYAQSLILAVTIVLYPPGLILQFHLLFDAYFLSFTMSFGFAIGDFIAVGDLAWVRYVTSDSGRCFIF